MTDNNQNSQRVRRSTINKKVPDFFKDYHINISYVKC